MRALPPFGSPGLRRDFGSPTSSTSDDYLHSVHIRYESPANVALRIMPFRSAALTIGDVDLVNGREVSGPAPSSKAPATATHAISRRSFGAATRPLVR
jgi:hypothetical protein